MVAVEENLQTIKTIERMPREEGKRSSSVIPCLANDEKRRRIGEVLDAGRTSRSAGYAGGDRKRRRKERPARTMR